MSKEDIKREIHRAVFGGGARVYKKGIVSDKWYRKNRTTLNAKLRQEIMDVLPFTVDKKLADVILWTIFDTIVEGVIRDGFTTIDRFGRFKLRYISARKYPFGAPGKVYPRRAWLTFELPQRTKRRMNKEGRDGDTGTD